MNFKLYILYSTKDYKIKYVGITKRSITVRYKDHLYELGKNNTYKQNWINSTIKNNFELRIKTIKKFNSSNEVKNAEIYLIKLLRTRGYKLTNSTSGGDGTMNLCTRSRKKMSDSRKGYIWKEESKLKLSITKKGKTSPMKGKKWEEKSKIKLSNTKKGQKGNSRRKVILLDKNNIQVGMWDSISEAAKFYNIVSGTIVNNIKGLSKFTKQGKWLYVNKNKKNK